MSKDRTDEAVNILADALEVGPESKAVLRHLLNLIIDQAVEEARNERKGLAGCNIRTLRGKT